MLMHEHEILLFKEISHQNSKRHEVIRVFSRCRCMNRLDQLFPVNYASHCKPVLNFSSPFSPFPNLPPPCMESNIFHDQGCH